MLTHLGLKIKEKEGNYLTKNFYLSAKPEGMRGWTKQHYPTQLLKAEINFDANIKFFNSLDYQIFDKHLKKQFKKFKFKECFNLNELNNFSGIYVIVLDNYKQIYIGIANDIKRRIRQHWNNKKSLERLIYGDVCNSILSIDSFGPLDTTRVFYLSTHNLHKIEEILVDSFDSNYLLNRTCGGIGSTDTYTNDSISARLAVISNRKHRNLLPFVDIKKLKEILSEKDFDYYSKKYGV